MDFGLLPPEINSGRMYTGPGAAPMMTAAAAWEAIAAELTGAAASYRSVTDDLATTWRGGSLRAMAAAVAPLVDWMTTTSNHAEQTAAQLRSAVTAYENAFTATVPPAVVASNRTQLWSLIATNLLGQNTAAIAATELLYSEMWAQDAAAMYGYAASSAAAIRLSPFKAPPAVTTDAGPADQAAATQAASNGAHASQQLSSALPHVLASIAVPAADAPADPFFTPAEIYVTALTSFLNGTLGPLSPVKLFSPFGSFFDFGVQTFLAPLNNFNMQLAYGTALGNAAQGIAPPVSPITPPSGVGIAGPALAAQAGNAGQVGHLSVPPGWATTTPAPVATVAAVLPQPGTVGVGAMTAGEDGIVGEMTLAGMAARAMTGAHSGVGTIGAGAGVIAADTGTTTIIVIPED